MSRARHSAPIGPARMSLTDHLGELRRRLIIIFASLLVAATVLYFITPQLIEFLIEPVRAHLPEGGLVILDPLGGFTVRFKTAFFAACFVCAPLVLWQVLAFLMPALEPAERKWFLPTFLIGVLLFCFGLVFCYLVILDPAFGWMLSQTDVVALALADASMYLRLIMGLEIGFGIAFEIPLLVFFLIIFGVVPYRVFRRQWRIIYLVMMIFSAMVTPDASPVTMMLLFAALVGLYEIALLLARVMLRRRIRASSEDGEERMQAAEEAGIRLTEGPETKGKE
ncbi:MAG: twin-arginine translocase subunit TatC [Coriobacteriales bacterium]|jgi:sec-independent protein translocase protein TatC|nr:twin-arginine translocase subunit TatC [Coriobacteriales bacterium]